MSISILLATTSAVVHEQVTAVLAESELGADVVSVESLVQLRHELGSDRRVDVALIDENLEGGLGFDAAREISLHHPLVASFLLVQYHDQETVVQAMDSGARGILPLPPSLEQVSQRIEAAAGWVQAARAQQEDQRLPTSGSGTVIALVGAKGGVGVSTLAAALARQGVSRGSTCLVDFDVRSGDLAAYCGIAVRRSIVDLVEIADEITGRALSEVIYPAAGGVHLLPAPADGELGEELTEHAARQILSALRFQYDLVILDCGSRVDDLLMQALDAADQILVVATPDVPAMRSSRRLDETIDRLGTAIGTPRLLVLNAVDRIREVQPGMAPKLADLPMAAAVPNLVKELDPVMNSATLLEANLPGLDRALAPVLENVAPRAGTAVAAPPADAPVERPVRRRRVGARSQRGQVSVELPIAVTLLLTAAILCLQIVLWGVTFMFASNAAHEAARSFGVGMSHAEVNSRVRAELPSGWGSAASVSTSGNTVTVSLRTPSIVDLPAVQATSTIQRER